eukprot:COSAG01_NODE_4558_length_4922_cov_11.336720_1_plen_52_part_00
MFSPWALSGAGRAPVGSPHFSCGPGNFVFISHSRISRVCVCVLILPTACWL